MFLIAYATIRFEAAVYMDLILQFIKPADSAAVLVLKATCVKHNYLNFFQWCNINRWETDVNIQFISIFD